MKNHVERVLGIPLSDQQYQMLREDWNAFTEEPYKYSVYAPMVIGYLNDKPKGKIEILQEVLRATLSDNNVSYLKEYWRAFYNNPEDFRDDRIIDLIVDDMGLTQFEEKENESMGFNWKSFMERNILLVNKITADNTMGYRNDGIYIRYIDKVFKVKGSYTKVNGVPYNYGVWSNYITGTVIIAMPDTKTVMPETVVIDEDDTYDFVGYIVPNENNTAEEIELLSYAYVPFTDGPNDSKIPVMWRVDGSNGAGIAVDALMEYFRGSGEFNNCMKSFADFLNDRFPSVDLKESKDQRYTEITLKLSEDATATFVYNRNHIAYNGNMCGEDKTLGVLAAFAATVWQGKRVETVTQWLRGDKHNMLILSGNADVSVTANVEEPEVTTKQEPSKEIETNPLLRAAKMASGSVE